MFVFIWVGVHLLDTDIILRMFMCWISVLYARPMCLCGEGVFIGETEETSCDRCEDTRVLPTITHVGLFIKTEEAAKDTLMCSLSNLCMPLGC